MYTPGFSGEHGSPNDVTPTINGVSLMLCISLTCSGPPESPCKMNFLNVSFLGMTRLVYTSQVSAFSSDAQI